MGSHFDIGSLQETAKNSLVWQENPFFTVFIIKIIDDKIIKLSDASKKLERITREAIQKMIIYTQIADNIELSHGEIKKKIDQLVYDRNLLDKFRRITK